MYANGTTKKISKLHNKELNIVVNGNQLNKVEMKNVQVFTLITILLLINMLMLCVVTLHLKLLF